MDDNVAQDGADDKQPATPKEFWDFGYKRPVSVIPPGAPLRPGSPMANRALKPGGDPRGKVPGLRGADGYWHGYDFTKYVATEDDLSRWEAAGSSVGLLCGNVGDGLSFLAIDADTYEAEHAEIVAEAVARHFGTLPKRIGSPPKAMYPILCRGPFPTRRVLFGPSDARGLQSSRCEILSDGYQVVVAGVHPKTGKPYFWERPLPPLNDLPVFDEEQIEAFLADLRVLLPNTSYHRTANASDVNQEGLKGPLELIREAVEMTPNTTAQFPERRDFIKYGYAIKGALQDHPAEALELYEGWADRWLDGENDADFASGEWRRMGAPYKIGASWVYEQAERNGFNTGKIHFEVITPEREAEIDAEVEAWKAADRRAAQERHPAEAAAKVVRPTRYPFPDRTKLPRRDWRYGRFYERGLGSLTVAPSGLGKTSLVIVEALAMATGKQLLGRNKPHGKSRVWIWNGEDPRDELYRKVEAVMLEYGLTRDDVGDRLMIDNGFDMPLKLASSSRTGPEIDEVAAQAITTAIIENGIDVLIIDPFVGLHTLSENDNGAMDLLAKRLARIAHDAKCAIGLVHHSRKQNGEETTIEDSRGASALLAAMRGARALTRMTPNEGAANSITDYWRYFRLGGVAKTSRSPQTGPGAENAEWLTIKDVSLGNEGDDPFADDAGGQGAGVVVLWNGAPTAGKHAEEEKLADILAEIKKAPRRFDVQSPEWVGHPIASVLGLDPSPKADRAAIRGVVTRLIKAGHLRVVSGTDRQGRVRSFVEAVGSGHPLARNDNDLEVSAQASASVFD